MLLLFRRRSALEASVTATAMVGGTLTVGGLLSATARGEATASGTLSVGALPLAASVTGVATVSAPALTVSTLAAAVTASASVAGTLTPQVRIAASVTAGATVAGTLTPPPPGAAPTNVRVELTYFSTTSPVKLKWDAASPVPYQYRIYRCLGASCSAFVPLQTISGSLTEQALTLTTTLSNLGKSYLTAAYGLLNPQVYRYRVVAVNFSGVEGPVSNIAQITAGNALVYPDGVTFPVVDDTPTGMIPALTDYVTSANLWNFVDTGAIPADATLVESGFVFQDTTQFYATRSGQPGAVTFGCFTGAATFWGRITSTVWIQPMMPDGFGPRDPNIEVNFSAFGVASCGAFSAGGVKIVPDPASTYAAPISTGPPITRAQFFAFKWGLIVRWQNLNSLFDFAVREHGICDWSAWVNWIVLAVEPAIVPTPEPEPEPEPPPAIVCIPEQPSIGCASPFTLDDWKVRPI
jgi:hypothetical protein